VPIACEPCRPFVFEQHVGAASAPLPPSYRPRQPEKTVLHRVVRENLETMLAEARERTEHGFGYPRFVEKAFRSFIDCGAMARGFVRLKCRSCGFERLLAFSCKSRICPHRHHPGAPASVDDPETPVVVPDSPPSPRRIPWAERLQRTIGLDLKRCPKCLTGTVAVLAYITDPKVVFKILSHLHLPTEVLAPSPARRSHLFEDFAQGDEAGGEVPWETIEGEADPRTRAPP
jgi:hypothetical protein